MDTATDQPQDQELRDREVDEATGEEVMTGAETEVAELDGEIDADASEAEGAGEADAPAVEADDEEDSDTRWYSLRVISGKERQIKERIEREINRNGWSESIPQIVVPTEKVFKFRNGKKVIVERNILPGYILVEAVDEFLNGETVPSIANLPNVIHFLGKNNPIPMREAEANRLLGKVDESQDAEETMIEPFLVGETVKIVDGPFNGFVGDVQEVNEEKKKLKVVVKIFGRGTEVELNFGQVEKQM